MKIISLEQIESILPSLDLIPEIEKGFSDYSQGRVVVPPVGEMILDKGEVHIKYGFVKKDAFYVIKVASGFYGNPALGLSSGNGLMLLFSQHTGELECILLDEGHLTNIRTAVAGAISARHMAPKNVRQIGIVGAGTQGKMQLIYLKRVIACRKVLVWGLDDEELSSYKSEMEKEGFMVQSTREAAMILDQCNLVVTATPSKFPLLFPRDLKPGTHITAVGSDTVEKQELDSGILQKADLVVADSIAQCMERGEIFKAMESGQLEKKDVVELGQVISGTIPGRTHQDQITIADLTGVAVQDINIAAAVYRAFTNRRL